MNNQVLDQTNDPGNRRMVTLLQNIGVPSFLKQAEVASVLAPTESRAALYGDPVKRQFPMHTKAATYISCLFFLDNQAEIADTPRNLICERLKSAAEYWGITNVVKDAEEKMAALKRPKSIPDDHYALVATIGDETVRRYPLRSSGEVKVAAGWFCEQLAALRNEYDYPVRQTIAKKILKRAGDCGCSLTPDERTTLEKTAGYGFTDPEHVKKAVTKRLLVTAGKVTEQVKIAMQKMASDVETQPLLLIDPDFGAQMATTLDLFDRAHGLTNKYAAFPSPEDTAFQVSLSEADELAKQACQLVTGSIYSHNQLSELSPQAIADTFGQEAADDVVTGLRVNPVKMAQFASSLDKPGADAVERLLNDVGQLPMAKHPSDYGIGFSFQQLKSLC